MVMLLGEHALTTIATFFLTQQITNLHAFCKVNIKIVLKGRKRERERQTDRQREGV